MEKHRINLIKFNVERVDVRSPVHPWINTNFWSVFDSSKYDLVQTVIAGPREYPFYKIPLPVVEIVALALGPNRSKNVAWTFHSSAWQRREWLKLGGSAEKSSVLPAPIDTPLSEENLREELHIPKNAIIAGFHQRASNEIFSPVPLLAFKKIERYGRYFIMKGGGSAYRDQAKELDIKNIIFLPSDGDNVAVSKFLNTIDIFAHGRRDGETFGAVLVEAMIHGKPCISHYSETGANAQIETIGPGGFFVKNQKEYEEKLESLFADSKLRESLSIAAREYASRSFSIQKCIDTVVTKYRQVIGLEPMQYSSDKVSHIPFRISKKTIKALVKRLWDYQPIEPILNKISAILSKQ
jgi:glycosyltransferase involved in cell wall biosynthesis